MWKVENDGSIMDARGNVVVFSAERFMKDVVAGDCCFLCGVDPKARPFDNLLVLPDWLLKRYDLATKTIRKPDGSTVRYDQNKVNCCRSCNILVSEEIERPVAQVIAQGGNAINEYIDKNGVAKIYIWLALLFVKTHIKDNLARYRLEPPESTLPLGYEWGKLHLIHSVVRGHLANVTVNLEVTGSFLSLPVRPDNATAAFDYVDIFSPQTAMVRFGDTAVVAVFDDTGAALHCFRSKLDRISGPLSEFQLREVVAELAYMNALLKDRPTYKTDAELETERLHLLATRPALALKDPDLVLRGKLLRAVLGNGVAHIKIPGFSPAQVAEALDAGKVTFLFGEDGMFIKNVAARPA